jgi:hypothetical protein
MRVTMATKAQLSRALDATLKVFQRAGMKPHVWIDPQGCPHIVEDDGLTANAHSTPDEEENPWEAYVRG